MYLPWIFGWYGELFYNCCPKGNKEAQSKYTPLGSRQKKSPQERTNLHLHQISNSPNCFNSPLCSCPSGRSTDPREATVLLPSSWWCFYPFLNVCGNDIHQGLSLVRKRNLRRKTQIQYKLINTHICCFYLSIEMVNTDMLYSHVPYVTLNDKLHIKWWFL